MLYPNALLTKDLNEYFQAVSGLVVMSRHESLEAPIHARSI